VWPWFNRNFVYRPISFWRGERALRHLNECRPRQWLPPGELERYRENRLGELIRHAVANVPFYRDLAGPAGTDFAKRDVGTILSRFPVVDKQQLKSEGPSFAAANVPGRKYRITTGGSTGEPLTLLTDGRAAGERRGSWYRFLEWWGIRPGEFLGNAPGRPGPPAGEA
jgi:phenylacetate-CoA ligase